MGIRLLTAVAVACVAASLLAAGAEAQSAGTSACASKLVGCAAYMNGTDAEKPPETCCSPLRDAVKNELPCLCALYASPEIFKVFNINITDALRLSKRCGISETTSSCPTGTGLAMAKKRKEGDGGVTGERETGVAKRVVTKGESSPSNRSTAAKSKTKKKECLPCQK